MQVRNRHYPRNKIPLSVTLEAWVLLASTVFAVWLVRSDTLAWIVAHVSNFGLAGSFVEGFFFTSILTTIPAIIAIFESASYVPAWELALVGGLGAVCGDLLIFRFVRSRLVEWILGIGLSPKVLAFGYWLKSGSFWWIGPLAGAIVIASPLPDEIGLVMMGLSRMRLIQFVPIVFIANAAGIYLIAIGAQSLF